MLSVTGEGVINAIQGIVASSAKVWIGLLTVFVVSKAAKYRHGVKAVSNFPGFRVPFFPMGFPGVAIPTYWWNPGFFFLWQWRQTLYKRFNRDTFTLVPFIFGPPTFYTSNLDVARQVIGGGHKTSFVKPESSSQILLLWGMNLIAADGDVWRKHRRVMGPAFNNQLYDLVWKETIQTYRDMISAEGWVGKDTVDVPSVQGLTFKFALLMIGKCGFGFSFNWAEPPRSSDGKYTIQEAVSIVTEHNILLSFTPVWVRNLRLPVFGLKKAMEAFDLMTEFMHKQVQDRKRDIQTKDEDELQRDVFTMLVRANEDEGSKFKLDDNELVRHDSQKTTAHTLAAIIGYLALYQDIQADAYQEVMDVIGNDPDPTPETYSKLEKVLAILYEALRMYPAGHVLIRQAYEDTVLEIPKPHGEEGKTTLPVEKGVHVIVDMVGVQYNPRYFDEPEKFKPSRWYGVTSESEMFSAFSVGPRACLGRKFAVVESICFISMLLRDYKVEPLLSNGESTEEWAKRVLDAKIVITLGVKDVPIKFVRRK
ncbi:cytochrome P450 [Panaeolus papilionaceus]|nr:cytochrome P450 [Panaeolus papilionaceus]